MSNIYILTESEHAEALKHLRSLMDSPDADKFTFEITKLAVAIEKYEKNHYPITPIDPELLERSKRRWEHEDNGGGRTFKPNGESTVPEYRYYIFNPNTGAFVGGPFACKTWARICMRDKQPTAGIPENEPYVVVDLLKDDIMLHKVDYKKKI